MSEFFTLYRNLHREGPGEAADVHWALAQLDRPPARVADLACGSGADLESLAQALPDARLTGIDRQDHFVREARARTLRFGARITLKTGDMADPGGPHDLIWCAGAVYFIGIKAALRAWKPCLAPGGVVAFSEPVLVPGPASKVVAEFWGSEGFDLFSAPEINGLITEAGFRTRASRLIIGSAWQNYYSPLENRIAALRPGASPALTQVLDTTAREIALWRQAPDQIAYLLSIVEPASDAQT